MNYDQITQAIANNEPFTHNGTLTGYLAEDAGLYIIESYDTVVYREHLETGNKWLNPDKYSQTTTRQQNLIKAAKHIN
jgi:hypothetical protein